MSRSSPDDGARPASAPGRVSASAASASSFIEEMYASYQDRIEEIAAFVKNQRSASCLYVDLSHLRRIEREIGPAQHADIYDQAGMALESMLGDLLSHSDLLCRYGEDGYLCVLAPATVQSATKLARLAGRVEERLNEILATEVQELVRDYAAVLVGHGRVLHSSLVKPEELVRRMVKDAEAHVALKREQARLRNKAHLQELILAEELTPVYQPIVALETSAILGYEAFTRGPKHTPLESPATLFAIAEESELDFELDRVCFATALKYASGLAPEQRLFVNVLPLSFYDASFLESRLDALLQSVGLRPWNLIFEITERKALNSFNEFRRALAAYTSRGFGIAIDDVGSRHSALETIAALRPDYIKVSGVLCRGVARSLVKRQVLRSLAHIAATIEATVVAEGVESADDLGTLYDLGIRHAQGYYLARPGPPFPRLRPSMKRAIAGLPSGARGPIAVPPAETTSQAREQTPAGLVMALRHGRDDMDEETGEAGARQKIHARADDK